MKPAFGLIVAAALAVAPGSAAATADGPDFFQVTGVAANDTLNLREAPDPQAAKIGEIPPDGTCIRNLGCQGGLTFREFTELSEGDREMRLKENPRWCRVEYRGITGWVAGRFLREGACSD
jgi:hypothetical protein